jgi:hypothetical protein
LKSRHRSAYVRLQWETIMSDGASERQAIDDAIRNAIHEFT